MRTLLKVGGATKAPDYSFRIGGTRKFFLEAKKPYCRYQVRYSSGLSIAPLRLECQASAQYPH